MTTDSRSVTYTGGRRGCRPDPVLLSRTMRSRPSIIAFVRLCAAAALGVYLGASVAGLVAVLDGEAFRSGSRWLGNVPVLAVVGAGVGTAVAPLTRRWLASRIARRWTVFGVAGAVTLPLFTAVSQMRAIETVGASLALAGGAVTSVLYWRASRSTPRSPAGSR